MNPILYEVNTTSFTTNGLGRLSDCISCVVQEVLNGIYVLEMVYPIDGVHYSLIEEHRILYAPHDDTKTRQPFEIYRISRPINGKVTVNAWHISYRLRKMVCLPFTATSVADAMDAMENNIVGVNPFTFVTDKTTSVTMKQRSPVVVKSLMGGMQGSVLDIYGGEWEYDNYVCSLKNRRGTDTDVSIRYGKNLTDVKKVSDATDLWTGIIPYWEGTDDNDTDIQVYYDGVIYSSAHEDYPYDMIIAMDASSDFDEQPTQAQLQTWGQNYVNANARAMIPTSVDISFVELWQTEEYKNVSALQRLFIGDTVHVYYEKLGIDNTARIVSYKYNVLLERYDSMTLGEVRASFTSAVKGDIEAVVGDIESNMKKLPTKSFVDRVVEHQTDMISGGLGGYVVLRLNANGEPEETLYMDTDDITTAVNVIRINRNGIGFSTTGYNGPYTNAWTIDGILNADFIRTGTMLANRIKGGTLSLGGVENGNGVLKVYDAAGVEIGQWNKDGITINKGTISGPNIVVGGSNNTSGILQVKNASGTVIVTLDNTGLTVNKGTISGPNIIVGGSSNVNGILKVKNASGTDIATMDNTGLTVNKGTINGPNIVVGGSNNTNGTLEVKNASGDTVITMNNSGITNKNGDDWSIFNSGYLKGGTKLYSSTTEAGYLSFNQFHTNTNSYGARLAGRGMVAIMTALFGVGRYAAYGATGQVDQGTTKNVTVVTGIGSPDVNVSLTTDHIRNIAICDSAGNVTGYYGDVEFVKSVSVSVLPNFSYDVLAFRSGLFNNAQ